MLPGVDIIELPGLLDIRYRRGRLLEDDAIDGG